MMQNPSTNFLRVYDKILTPIIVVDFTKISISKSSFKYGFSPSTRLFLNRVIYQNERYDDWTPRLAKIKQVLVNYKEVLETYHKRQLPKGEAEKMPTGKISCAADGNYLETLNLSSSGWSTRSFRNSVF